MSGLSNEAHTVAPTLASKNLPRRTRNLLEGILEFASDEFERGVTSSLNDFEQQLFKHAEQARSAAVQTRWLEAQRLIKRTRPDLVPRFLIALEAELSTLREPFQPKHLFMSRGITSNEMTLVNELEMDEGTIMTEISNRAEMRNSLPLYLLGQRFGVLAGKPAFDSESLPIGPQAVCRMLRDASDCLGLNEEHRLMFFKVFEKQVMPVYGNLIESINNYLAKNNVLPNLQYVPIRARPKSQNEVVEKISEGTQQASKRTASQSLGLSLDDLPHRNTARSSLRHSESLQTSPLEREGITALAGNLIRNELGKNAPAEGAAPGVDFAASVRRTGERASEIDMASFNMMRQLLASRKQLLGKLNPEKIHTAGNTVEPVPIDILQKTLQMLQSKPATPIVSGGKRTARSIQHIKQDLMSHLRMDTGNQEAPVLEPEDNDTIDLLGMLFESINKDVKENSPAALLLAKLQVPLMRVALQDKSFFTKENHPARQMLGTIAESGAYWMSDDDTDPALLSKMNAVVDRTVREFDGDMSLFQQLLLDINSHLQILSRKAEVAEKRHIEAARGKEKLALAREQAATAVNGLLKDQALPRFTHTLLSQAWTDVMALTALRSGEDSDSWKQHLHVAERLIQVAKAPPGQSPISADEALQLKQELESSLTQVGYQEDEATAITERLIDPLSGKEGDSASRTELTMRLKSRARFGEDVAGSAKKIKLTAEEQARYEQLKSVAFGTWFEFTTNQQGDRVRRRLAWYSTVTGHSLFVNQRGQKVGEYHLEALAKMMAQDELHIVEEQAGGLIDRAWQSVMNALRSFAGQPGTEAPAK